MPSTIAVDLAKSVFQVALATRTKRVIEHRRLSRGQFDRLLRQSAPARVVMEACGTAHHWGRVALAAGHEVRLLPPKHSRPYVRRNKTDRGAHGDVSRSYGPADVSHWQSSRPA